MKYLYTIILVLLCTNIFSQSFETISQASDGKKMIFSIYVTGFNFTSPEYDNIIVHGDSLLKSNPDHNVMALYFIKKDFSFETYQESVDLFNYYLKNKYDHYNNICIAMYKQNHITLRPFKYFYEQRFK